MASTQEIVAAALAHAEAVTPEHFAPKNECPDDAHAARYVTTIEGGSQLDGKESTLAEAVAWAEDPGGENSDHDGRWCQYPDHVVYVRRDLFTNALVHLATRVAAAEERAARLRREVCDAIHEYTVSGDARHVADDLRRAVDEYDAAEEVSRG